MSVKRPRSAFSSENLYEKIYGTSEIRKKLKLLSQNSMQNKQISHEILRKQADFEDFLAKMPIKPVEIAAKEQEFLYSFSAFLENKGKFLQSTEFSAFFHKFFRELREIFLFVKEKGGFEEMTCQGKWQELAGTLGKSPNFAEILKENRSFKEIYQEFLFHFEKTCGNAGKNPCFEQKLEEMDPKLLENVEILAVSQENSMKTPRFLEKALLLENCVFRGFFPELELDNAQFSLETLQNAYNLVEIELREQKPMVFSFEPNKTNRQTAKFSTIGAYIDYQRSFREDAANSVDFAVNIDVLDWENQVKELRKLPEELLWRSSFDCLRHLQQEISGVTTPQMYLKVKGCYTGGHEENLRVQTVNINHGPADSVWYLIDSQHVPRFRSLIQTRFHVDIHFSEGLWFGPVDFCLQNGVPVKKIVQKPGDIVYLNAGTLHWVIGTGVAVHTSWNFAHKSLKVLRNACVRLQINEEIGFKSIIPLKFLLFQLLSSEYRAIPKELTVFCLEKVKEFVETERKLAKTLEFSKQPRDSRVFFCEGCAKETFLHWVLAESPAETRFLCVKCAEKREKRPKSAKFSYFARFQAEELQDFFEAIASFLDDRAEPAISLRKYRIKRKPAIFEENSVSLHKIMAKELYFNAEEFEIRDEGAENQGISKETRKESEEFEEKSKEITHNILSKLISVAKR